jgi:hypothetical protein
LQVLNYPHKYFVEISASEMTDNKPLEKGSTNLQKRCTPD